MSAKLRVATLGCKVNQYETELVRQGLQNIGYQDCDDQSSADVCLVNTCTVTNEGDAKSRQVIRRMARQNPEAKIVVMGCYATRAPDEVGSLPGVSEVVTDKRELPDLMSRFGVIDVPTGLDGFSGRHRAYVKVQDGCLLRCSYCIIPMVRPKLTSRPLQEIVDEVGRLIDAGHREVVLTGIHLGHYGVDWNRNQPRENWVRLANLMEKLATLPGDFRIRLSSIEATEVTRQLIGVMKDHAERIVPHLHLCLQAGSDSVLRRMRRRWGTRMFLDRCQMLREALDRPAITTDVIAGFPGETEDEFQQSLATCRSAGFSKIHAFPFSARRGTPAAEMANQITKDEKARRVDRLRELETELRRDYFAKLQSSRLQLLVESKRSFQTTERSGRQLLGPGQTSTLLRGTTCRYASAELLHAGEADDYQTGDLIDVTVAESHDDRLIVCKV
ncbi:MAG: tRNA (N(6)-L-threonylcarbamoyladenosine(37)-C(2))-methylthiotransferase MtaB [Planctomycetota bacterium]